MMQERREGRGRGTLGKVRSGVVREGWGGGAKGREAWRR